MGDINKVKIDISSDFLNFSFNLYAQNKLFTDFKNEYSKLRIAINRTYYGFYRLLSVEYAYITDSSIPNKHLALAKAIKNNNIKALFVFLKDAREWADYEITDPPENIEKNFKNIQYRVYRELKKYL